jgi:transcriptional regulator with XRE-family HTH domain
MNAATLIRQARTARGLDQATLARRAGTTQTYVSRVERGKISPTVTTLTRLMAAMGLELELSAKRLSPGNVAVAELQSDLARTTPSERLEQAMELSEFLTGVSVRARKGEPA